MKIGIFIKMPNIQNVALNNENKRLDEELKRIKQRFIEKNLNYNISQ